MAEVCGTCKHWVSAGECWRYPPQMVPWPEDPQRDPIIYLPVPVRPMVEGLTRACGEWGFGINA